MSIDEGKSTGCDGSRRWEEKMTRLKRERSEFEILSRNRDQIGEGWTVEKMSGDKRQK